MNILKKIINKFLRRGRTKLEQEIYEQPGIIFELIKRYVNKNHSINLELPENVKSIVFIASGSSYNSAAIAEDFIRNKLKIKTQSFYASEVLINLDFKTNDETLYIFISQSGETADTNAALNLIRKNTDKTLAVTNTKNSKLYNNSEYKILTHAGTEKSITASKTMTAQTFCLFLTALKLAQMKNIPDRLYLEALLTVPEYIKNVFTMRSQIKKQAQILLNYDDAVILSSGMFYPAAQEGALKLKETSYINVSAYPAGEFLHGHIAVLNKKCAVITAVNDLNLRYAIDVLMRINGNYNTDTIVISSVPVHSGDKKDFIHIDSKNDIDFLFSLLVIFQFLSLETALLKNNNPDFPGGLEKVVK